MRQAEGKNLMCCFLPVHSWHSSLPFSFFYCDFFFSFALIVKPRVHSQPSPTAPVWLSHRKLGFLLSVLSLSLSFSMYEYSVRPSHFLFVCFFVSLYMSVSVVSFFVHLVFCICLHWSICLFVSIPPLFFCLILF